MADKTNQPYSEGQTLTAASSAITKSQRLPLSMQEWHKLLAVAQTWATSTAVNIATVRDHFYFYLPAFSEKWTKCSIVYITTMIILFLSFYRLEYLLSIFLKNLESAISLYFELQFMRQSKNSITFLFLF